MIQRVSAGLFFAASLALVMAATLWPTPFGADPVEQLGFLTRGLHIADALRNVVLFLPLGAALALVLRSPTLVVGVAGVLSISLELAQFLVPGRHPALEDLLFNTTGALIGAAVTLTSRFWLRPSDRAARILGAGAALAIAAVLVLTVRLFDPWLPGTTYYGGWTLDLEPRERYSGRVVTARIGDVPIPADGPVADSEELRRLLRADAPLRIHAVAGTPPAGLAPLLTIHDDGHREILMVGIDGADLVISQRVRGRARRFEQPVLHLPGWLSGVSRGDPIELVIEPSRSGYCVELNGARRCGLGPSLGSGWSFVFLPNVVPSGLKLSVNALWLLALFAPLGYWHRSWLQSAPLGALLLLLLLLPRVTGLVHTPRLELAGPVAGFLAGLVLSRWSRSRSDWYSSPSAKPDAR